MKTALLAVLLLTSVLLHPYNSAAQSTSEPSVAQPATKSLKCEYEGKRGEKVPINPKTNKPYMLDERNQEPFDGGSISKDEIRQCLQAKTPVKNHHIVFGDYWKAWASLAKETGDYAIPILIKGGVLHAPYDRKANTGGIRLWKFRDPNVSNGSNLTEEERKAFRIEQKNAPIALIRSQISWQNVFIDSEVIPFMEDGKDAGDILSVIYSARAYFSSSTFNAGVDFSSSTFNAGAIFSSSTFNAEVDFLSSTFNAGAIFSSSTFNAGAIFSNTQFKNNADFRGMIVDSEQLVFDNTTWEKRLDLRNMNVKELHWVSTQNPSDVKGVFDFREASVGSATFKEVRFQDIVDFSRATFGQYKEKKSDGNDEIKIHPLPQVLFESNSFEKEADFLHVKFFGPAIFINNRFRSTFDLTGATFEPQNSRTSTSQENQPHLCLSFNRIIRLVLEPRHLGEASGFWVGHQLKSLFGKPLEKSRIRQIVFTKEPTDKNPENEVPNCMNLNPTDTITRNGRIRAEPLDDIYKTLGTSFREANDRTGINESGYLETLAKRRNDSGIKAFFSWLLFDVPSRYTVDVGRVVWISIGIMIVFYYIYFREFGGAFNLKEAYNNCLDSIKETRLKDYSRVNFEGIIETPKDIQPFRLRLFETIHTKDSQPEKNRNINPSTDAAILSMRSFLKLGLGAKYPNTKRLKFFTTIEWVLGAYMLAHFVLSVKNNLPFIADFLGVAN